MHELLFVCLPGPAQQTRLLIRSLRQFGGALSGAPVWVMVPAESPADGSPAFEPDLAAELAALGARVVPFEAEPRALTFPFALKVWAAAAAEAAAVAAIEAERGDQAARLVWLDSDTLFLQPPLDLLIHADSALGCCPVHHRLIGSPYDAPPDAFWSLIYARCGVDPATLFPMRTVVDGAIIRPYVNAGLLVVRPRDRLLHAWRDRFAALMDDPAFAPFYDQNARYRVFMHQAVLAGVLLAALHQPHWTLLPGQYNYPLHLWEEDRSGTRPASVSELVTCRYEQVLSEPDWPTRFPMAAHLREWLAAQLAD